MEYHDEAPPPGGPPGAPEVPQFANRAEERSYLSCPDIAQCFNTDSTKKMVDYAWRPVTDAKLLGFLGSVACKKRGWFPYENGHALVSHRAKARRSPEPIYKVKDYPYRVSMILRKGTWWIVERAQDLRQNNKTCFLEEEEAEVLVPLFLRRLPTRSRVCRNCLLSWLISFSSILLILCMEVPVRAVRQLE